MMACSLLLVTLAIPLLQSATADLVSIHGFEAEHRSILPAPKAVRWTPPILDAAQGDYLFAWRYQGDATVRNTTQLSATVTLTADDHKASDIVCHSNDTTNLSLVCGGGSGATNSDIWALPAVQFTATLELTFYVETALGPQKATTRIRGSFVRGLPAATWGGAEWIGLENANDTASQYRGVTNLKALGFQTGRDVVRAFLFVSALGGYRASINGRPLDPTSVRASITEWHNRTYYWADDVTSDIVATLDVNSGGNEYNGEVVIAVELFKHWYGLSNNFYLKPYGPRSLKCVLVLTHANETIAFAAPTLPGPHSVWTHHSGSLLFDDLHKGQTVDGSRATPGWESTAFASTSWAAPKAVTGPPGHLQAHPMQHSRVLERLIPVNVTSAPSAHASPGGVTYRVVLPYEVPGFCTLLLPHECPTGTKVEIRHGECVDPKTNLLCPVEAPNIEDSALDTFFCRGNTTGMNAHDISWRRLALSGNATDEAHDDQAREAFTPAFTFSAFKYLDLTFYPAFRNSSRLPAEGTVAPPDISSIRCFRIGVGFDHIGDLTVNPPGDDTRPQDSTPTAAERLNAVVSAGRSTALANYVMDIPTDSPQEEKRGWLGDSLATHRTYAAFFDMRAAWIKWTEDQAFTSSLLPPQGTITATAPCIFDQGLCFNDPRGQGKATSVLTGVAWGSILPQLSAFTAAFSGDSRYAGRLAGAAARYTSLLQHYANNGSYAFPQLLNISSIRDHYNVARAGWPASSYGDWCPVNSGGGGCTSASSLLNSAFFIFDLDASLGLLRMSGSNGAGVVEDDLTKMQNGTTPTGTQMAQWLKEACASFEAAFLHRITVSPPIEPGKNASSNITGLAFRDLYPANITHHGTPNHPPSAQTEAAVGMGVMDPVLNTTEVRSHRGALADMLAALVMNATTQFDALQTGGVLDMAHLGRSLVSFGRTDAAIALLATDGPTSFYHMAASTGTLWAHPGGADGNKGRCSSHNHVMQGGSIGEAVFGLGGIRPAFTQQVVPAITAPRLLLAPVPWLPEMPLGAAAWRTLAGVASTRWAAIANANVDIDVVTASTWSVWVNVTVPSGLGADPAQVQVMFPRSTPRNSTCVWECGPEKTAAFTSEFVSFGSTAGYNKIRALAPSTAEQANVQQQTCSILWRSGAVEQTLPMGISKVDWSPALPGYFMFPSLNISAFGGSYSFFARACS